MHRSLTGTAVRLLGGLAVVVAAGCTAPGGVSEAGFAEPTVTLTLGVTDSRGRYSWDLAEDFARRVDAATSGTVQVTVTDADTEVPTRWNQALAERAIDGDLDLALVQGQAWDALGVGSLTALYVPFLVSDEEVLDAVATSDLADALMAGLEETGVTALALIPGGLRYSFVDGGAPPRTPEDLQGLGVRVGYSEAVWSLYEALGGHPDDPNGSMLGERLRDGSITVLDSTLSGADGVLSAPAVVGDLSTYPLAFTLVANEGALADLSTSHQDDLREAARETARWATQSRPSEADAARALCERNPRAQVVVGDDATREAWRRATRDLAAQLRADPDVDALAVRIEELAATVTPAEPVQACQGGAATPAAPTTAPRPNVPPDFPEGTYRKEISAQDLIDLGVNPGDAHNHDGVWTITLRDGHTHDPDCPGTYEVVDQRLVITLGPDGRGCGEAVGQVLFSSGWHLDGTQLTFTDVRSGHGSDVLIEALFGTAPWTKIG